MKKILASVKNKSYSPFIVLFAVSFFIHLFIRTGTGDDAIYASHISDLFPWLRHLYLTWSVRTLIDLTAVILCAIPSIVWKIADAAVFAFIGYGFSLLFGCKNNSKMNWIISFVLLLYPFYEMASAGWIVTTVSYLWPLCAGIYALIPLARILTGEKISAKHYIASLIGLIFAINNEQMAACLFGIILCLGIYIVFSKNIKDKSKLYYLAIQLTICAAMLLIAFTCPGMDNRYAKEVVNRFPGFDNISLFSKLEMGFSSTMYEMTMQSNYIFAILCILLAWLSFSLKKGKLVLNSTASIPALIYAIFGLGVFPAFFNIIPEKCREGFITIPQALTNTGTNPTFSNMFSLLPDAVLVLSIVCICITIISVFGNKRLAWLSLLLLGVGFASRMMMSFSPTIWASGPRTFIFMYGSIIASIILLTKQLFEKHEAKIHHGVLVAMFLLILINNAFSLMLSIYQWTM